MSTEDFASMVTIRRLLIRLKLPVDLIRLYLQTQGTNWSLVLTELIGTLRGLCLAHHAHVGPKTLSKILKVPISRVTVPAKLLLKLVLFNKEKILRDPSSASSSEIPALALEDQLKLNFERSVIVIGGSVVPVIKSLHSCPTPRHCIGYWVESNTQNAGVTGLGLQ